MRALIDAHMLGAHETGNETYSRGLLDGLAQIGSRQVVAVGVVGVRGARRLRLQARPTHEDARPAGIEPSFAHLIDHGGDRGEVHHE